MIEINGVYWVRQSYCESDDNLTRMWYITLLNIGLVLIWNSVVYAAYRFIIKCKWKSSYFFYFCYGKIAYQLSVYMRQHLVSEVLGYWVYNNNAYMFMIQKYNSFNAVSVIYAIVIICRENRIKVAKSVYNAHYYNSRLHGSIFSNVGSISKIWYISIR